MIPFARALAVTALTVTLAAPAFAGPRVRWGTDRGWPYRPYRQTYDQVLVTPDGYVFGVVPVRPSVATYGASLRGTTCTAGRIEDVPEKYRALYFDGEAAYGPAYAGQRCLTTR